MFVYLEEIHLCLIQTYILIGGERRKDILLSECQKLIWVVKEHLML